MIPCSENDHSYEAGAFGVCRRCGGEYQEEDEIVTVYASEVVKISREHAAMAELLRDMVENWETCKADSIREHDHRQRAREILKRIGGENG